MTNRIRVLLVSVAAIAALFGITTPAHAATTDHRRCVTKAEYKAIHLDMQRRAAQSVLDGPGRGFTGNLWDGAGKGWAVRHYGVCGAPAMQAKVIVIYYLPTDSVYDLLYVSYKPRYDNLI